MTKNRTIFTFYAPSFNTKKNKKYFINPNNYGDDLAVWLADELEKRGAILDRKGEFPGQEDFGWYVNFQFNNKSYCLIIGGRPDNNDGIEWVGWIENQCGFFWTLLGRRNKNVGKESFKTIHEILSTSDKVKKLRWHIKEDFDRGYEDTACEDLDA